MSIREVDWKALQGVSRPKLLELASCEYLVRGEDVVLAGPIGTGKTLLAIALGVEAARRRKRVAFIRAADLVRDSGSGIVVPPDDASAVAEAVGRLYRMWKGEEPRPVRRPEVIVEYAADRQAARLARLLDSLTRSRDER